MGLFNNSKDTETRITKLENHFNGEIFLLKQNLDEWDVKETERDKKYTDLFEGLQRQIDDIVKNKIQEQVMLTQEEKAKEAAPTELSCNEVCTGLKGVVKLLSSTTLKYYLYENGILDLNINKVRDTYSLSKSYKDIDSELKKYIHVHDNNAVTFLPEFVDYLKSDVTPLVESIGRYERRHKQFKESKDKLTVSAINNFKEEIHKICGIKDSYDPAKYGALYARYGVLYPGWEKNYEKYKTQHTLPNFVPTKLTYIFQERGHGEILLKIACELYVD